MAKNLIPQVSQMLGVELGEEFKITGYGEAIYKFTNDGLVLNQRDGFGLEITVAVKAQLDSLLNGKDEIIKLPWKPKVDETYYSFSYRQKDETWVVTGILWDNDVVDNALFKAGWIFKTEDEAREALSSIATEAGAKYEQ
jgi:hypothetical protein